MTLCCALPKSLNEYHVWVVLVGDSLTVGKRAIFVYYLNVVDYIENYNFVGIYHDNI